MAVGWFPDATVKPIGIVSAENFGVPSVKYATQTINPIGIAAGSMGTPVVILGKIVLPIGIASQEAFGTPSIVQH